MIQAIEIDEILKMLPHRYPFIFVDKVLEFEPHKHLVAIKNITINEPFFTGHFPDKPIMPGVLMLEALAQACLLLSYKSLPQDNKHYLHFLAGVNNARFKHMVVPGDQLRLEATFKARKKDIWVMGCEASVDGKLACAAELMSAAKEIKRD